MPGGYWQRCMTCLTRLAELDSHLHCSVIGTCMTTSELRKPVPRFTTLDRQRATDLEIHHEAVKLSSAGGQASGAAQHGNTSRCKPFARSLTTHWPS